MLQGNALRRFVTVFLFVAMISLLVVGCTDRKNVNIDITDKQDPNNVNQTPPNQNPPNNNNQSPEINAPIDSNEVNFLNINLVGGEPPLQSHEGIFYFTKSQHPPEVENSFRYDTHNGWLIQLDDPLYRGHKIKVQKIKRIGSVYDITVRLVPGGDNTKPAYGFFEVGILDMPTTSKFRIYDETGKKLWPKF